MSTGFDLPTEPEGIEYELKQIELSVAEAMFGYRLAIATTNEEVAAMLLREVISRLEYIQRMTEKATKELKDELGIDSAE